MPYDPAAVAAIIDNRWINAATEDAHGVDLLMSYQAKSRIGDLGFSLNAAHIDLTQTISALSPGQQLSGTIFNPPKWRMRGGASWQYLGWASSAFLNYVGSSTNRASDPPESISSWITADAQIGYAFRQSSGVLYGLRLLVSAQNLFDRSPAHVSSGATIIPGLHYDSTNTSAIGRFVTAQVIKDW
jgi:hypothetical protein